MKKKNEMKMWWFSNGDIGKRAAGAGEWKSESKGMGMAMKHTNVTYTHTLKEEKKEAKRKIGSGMDKAGRNVRFNITITKKKNKPETCSVRIDRC